MKFVADCQVLQFSLKVGNWRDEKMFNRIRFMWIIGVLCLFSTAFIWAGTSGNIHRCAGAGFWFPAGKKVLARAVDDYLKENPPPGITGRIMALISPHAGYRYCGPVMGAGYGCLKGHRYKRVIILAFSHRYGGYGKISVLPVDAYETPLGSVSVDGGLVAELLKHTDVFTSIPRIHKTEHSDENQLPFLQRTLKNFSLVSLFVDTLDKERMKKAVDILTPYVDKDTLLIASTDLNHYGTGYGYSPFKGTRGKALVGKIHNLDREALKYMASVDPDGFRAYIKRMGSTVCGHNPVELLLRILKKKGNVSGKILKYYTSADREGNYATRTCGYGSVVFTIAPPKEIREGKKMPERKIKSPTQNPDKEPDPPILTKPEQDTLLRLARHTLTGITKDRSYRPDISKYEITPHLKAKSRLFVTLTENGRLRGCIGHVQARMPIYKAVIANTWKAAFEDPRFPSVRAEEVPKIKIEISINTPQRRVTDVNQIVVGKHGLIIEKGWHRGILLPQVPVEWGWDRAEFLKAICRKARLPLDVWKDKDAKLYIYSSQVFHEPSPDTKKGK